MKAGQKPHLPIDKSNIFVQLDMAFGLSYTRAGLRRPFLLRDDEREESRHYLRQVRKNEIKAFP
jgi:hypothetical protein